MQQQQAKTEPAGCGCLSGAELGQNEAQEAPLYTQLGSAPSVEALRRSLETRLRLSGPEALRIEKVAYTAHEGVSEHGCPVAKWIIRRSGEQEKLLALVRERPGHECATAVTVVAIVSWEAVPQAMSDRLFEYLPAQLSSHGVASERRCAANETRTCGCQGFDENSSGASYTFGCSWSMFHNACKFARTRENARKFRLRSADGEAEMGNRLNCLADVVGRVLQDVAPDAFETHTRHSAAAADCRLGSETPTDRRPFSGVTVCLDFCAHPHKDTFLIDAGCSAVVTLSRTAANVDDEQLHVLPNCLLAESDGCAGRVQALTSFPKVTRVRAVPLAPCTSRKKSRRPPAASAAPKEENSPASIDSGFESIKSNHSPGKDELSSHHSPPVLGFAVAPPPLPPPQLQLQQHQHQQQYQQHQQPMSPLPPPPASPTLPPIASWFRKSAAVDPRQQQPPPPQQQQQLQPLQHQQQQQHQQQHHHHQQQLLLSHPQPPLPPPPPPGVFEQHELQYHHQHYHPHMRHPYQQQQQQPYGMHHPYTAYPHCAHLQQQQHRAADFPAAHPFVQVSSLCSLRVG